MDYAYAQLVSEGYIEARPYKGYFVCPLEELLILEEENSGQDRRMEGQNRQQSGKWPYLAAIGKEENPGAENGRQPGMLWTADAETGILQAGVSCSRKRKPDRCLIVW